MSVSKPISNPFHTENGKVVQIHNAAAIVPLWGEEGARRLFGVTWVLECVRVPDRHRKPAMKPLEPGCLSSYYTQVTHRELIKFR